MSQNTVQMLKGKDAEIGQVGFNGAAASGKIDITGSKGANAALTSLLAALVTLGLITDSTT